MQRATVSKDEDGETIVGSLLEQLSGTQFKEWRQERRYRQNIKNGKPYFNGPSTVPEPERHSPSQLLQCHRKLVYRQENAPEEQSDPDGIFWFGSRFEEDLLFPFLEEVVSQPTTYIQNSIWIDHTVETDTGTLRIKGATDPVIVDSEAVPVLPTEVKTKDSIDHISEPNVHHRAQLHAYLAGLSEKFDKELCDGVLVYGSRESLDLKVFHVAFDEDFWSETVLNWAEAHTEYRLSDELPPADPEYSWECRFCNYQQRCGKGDTAHSNYAPQGFLPGFVDYPREKVAEYLEAHPDAALTPVLAERYPELAEHYPILGWYCSDCDSEIPPDEVDPDGEPLCPKCAQSDRLSVVSLRYSTQDQSQKTQSEVSK